MKFCSFCLTNIFSNNIIEYFLRILLFDSIFFYTLSLEGGENEIPSVQIKEGESFEIALKRFKKQCEKAGILSGVKRQEHYEKPSVQRKRKALVARKEH